MDVHEHQAKGLFRESGIPVPRGSVAGTPGEALEAARGLGGSSWAVKAQIHAGGRGKAGGVKIARTPDEVEAHAAALLGRRLVTHQTGPGGREVLAVLVEEGLDIVREHYLGLVLDRAAGKVAFMACAEGGVDIEDVAAREPGAIVRAHVDPAAGFTPFVGRKVAVGMGFAGKEAVGRATAFLGRLYDFYVEKDCDVLEINPLVTTRDGGLVALDAKLSFDDNALPRHPELEGLRDPSEENDKEREAKAHGLSYIDLDGDIGCLVNGAGLAMATMDIIKLHGGEPANFLDVGGGASKEAVQKAFSIILSDKKVKAVLVNIFGGIMRCDIIAEGVVAATRELGIEVPLVVRLEGTNIAFGKKILAESGLAIVTADDLADAAKKAVKAAGAGAGGA